MNDTLAGALVGGALALIAVLVGRLLEEVFRSRARDKSRKSFLSALGAEALATMHGLRGLLEISEESGIANTLKFLRLLGHQTSAGSVLLGLLPNLGLLRPSLVHQLAAAYMRVRVAAQMAQALAAKKNEDMIAGREVDGVRQEIRTALAALEDVEADIARMLT